MIRINLLPRAPRRGLPGRQVLELGLPVLVLVVGIVYSIVLSNQLGRVQDQIKETDEKIAEIRPTVDRVAELDRLIAGMRRKEGIVADLLRQQLPAASILNEIRLLVPKEVWILNLSVPEEASLSLEGMAMNYYAVARLMDNLVAGQLFRRTDLTVVQLEKVGAADVVRFQVTARIVKPQATGGERP
ncbi:MAG: PilN domain-containing protein [Armatimonadetes bacterium]|nr:PilN domain-containing protein [Armatimonadota bacterium]